MSETNNTPEKYKISALVITYNEEKNIENLLQNLGFVDELIIVDSFSTDQTTPIVTNFDHVKLVQNQFKNYSVQRNFALDLAQNPWVLFLDADERISPALEKEILETVRQENTATAYYFRRKFMFQNKPLHFSGWQTDKNIRLFKRGKARYALNRMVHEKLEVIGPTATLKNQLIHFSYKNYKSYKAKMVSYGQLKAKELLNQKIEPSLFHFYIKPTYTFLYGYILRLGILDGKKGLIICYLNALSTYERYSELQRLQNKGKN